MDAPADYLRRQGLLDRQDRSELAPPCTVDVGARLTERSQRGWRRIVLNLLPCGLGGVKMGTGIVSIPFHNLPYSADWLYWIFVVIFSANIIISQGFLNISILRYNIFRGDVVCNAEAPCAVPVSASVLFST